MKRPYLLASAAAMLVAAGSGEAAEGRIPISGQTTISVSGSYLVTQDFAVTTGRAIDITAGNVTIDLGGHTISSSDSVAPAIANNGTPGVHIKNGRVLAGDYSISLWSVGGIFTVDGVTMAPNSFGMGKGLRVSGASPVVIRGVTIFGSAGSGCMMYLLSVDNAQIESNVVRNCASGITLENSDNALLTHNSISGSTGRGLQLIAGATNSLIIDNTISNNSAEGIYVSDSSNNIIDRNTISLNYTGITIDGSSQTNQVSNNNVSGGTFGLLMQQGAAHNRIIGNNVSRNAENIVLGNASYNELYRNLTVRSGIGNGIYLDPLSDYNTIDQNTSSNNGDDATDCGIYFSLGSDNNIYRNNLTLDNGLGCVLCGICNNGTGNLDAGGNFNVN